MPSESVHDSPNHQPRPLAQAGDGFLHQICAYFRDFLDSDFRRQRLPKRAIALRDQRGNLTGISIAKYPELALDLWQTLAKPLDHTLQLTFAAGRGRYRGHIRKPLLEVIEKHVDALKVNDLAALADRIRSTARELRASLENDPERYRDTVVNALRNDLVRTIVSSLVQRLEASLEREGSDAFETSYDIETELGARLVADGEEAIGSALAFAIVNNDFKEFDGVIAEIAAPDTIRRRLVTYFETFTTADFFQELHELRSTLKLRDNFETYLYIGELRHNRVSYPLFYLPIEVTLEDRLFRISADPHLYINKKALDYAGQEVAREIGRAVPIMVDDRIEYLQEGQSFIGVMQSLLDRWCADLALKPPIDLKLNREQRAARSQITIINTLNLAAFDKSDEAMLNDYEEIMSVLGGGTDAAQDFRDIVMGFLSRDPVSVQEKVESEWSRTPIEQRLVFQSPVPLNEEQRKILAALRQPDGRFIAIEGPPGTGKSHTITAIVFEAILKGQNVLVLSDKKEALDVVEDKLTHVLNSVRFDDDFQNPILRLGRSGSSYGRILSTQSVEAIRAHHRAMEAATEEISQQIKEDEARLTAGIRALADRGQDIDIRSVAGLHRHETRVATYIKDTEAFVADDLTLEALDAVRSISELLSENGGIAARILRAGHGSSTIEAIEYFLELQSTLAEMAPSATPELAAMRFFTRFHAGDLAALQDFIREYLSARWPLLGFLFTRGRAREIDSRLGRGLACRSALDAHRRLDLLRVAEAAFASLGARLVRHGLSPERHALAYQQILEGLQPIPDRAKLLRQCVARIRRALDERPLLMAEATVHPDKVEDWIADAASPEAERLRDLGAFVHEYQGIKERYAAIPAIDYAGEKARLESLHAQRLAHTIDGRLIVFADNHRNLSRSIKDIIRKRQRFPKDNFEALKNAFPCVIAGIRDYAEYVPLEKGLFDIVIIDEASQVSIAQAFPAFIRAKKLVVLGDRKQFSNVKTATASIETNNQYMNAIVEGFRRDERPDVDTLNRLKLFNIKTSVLEFVERIANYQTMLRKHFRGYPELISFSSKTFYKGQLQAVKIRGKPIDQVLGFTLVEHDGRSDLRSNVNTLEFEAILAELRRLAGLDTPPSVGIITPFAEQQAYIVQNVAKQSDGERLQDGLDLKVMTFDSCQGEERDVILYSFVATEDVDKLSYIFPRSLEEADEVDHVLRLQRLNVGFSRAKERMQFFISKPVQGFGGAIVRALAHYQGLIEEVQKRPPRRSTDPRSPMERRVLEWLDQTPFRQQLGPALEIEPQFELGAYLRQLDPRYRHPDYRVDFLLKINTVRRTVSIIIEYDGFKEHFANLDEADANHYREYYKPEDVERQKILESYGYRFLRINRFNVGKDPVRTLDERLRRLARDAIEDARPHQIVQDVIDKADGLMTGDMRQCSSCGSVKPLKEFKDAALKSGFGRKCRACKDEERGRAGR